MLVLLYTGKYKYEIVMDSFIHHLGHYDGASSIARAKSHAQSVLQSSYIISSTWWFPLQKGPDNEQHKHKYKHEHQQHYDHHEYNDYYDHYICPKYHQHDDNDHHDDHASPDDHDHRSASAVPATVAHPATASNDPSQRASKDQQVYLRYFT